MDVWGRGGGESSAREAVHSGRDQSGGSPIKRLLSGPIFPEISEEHVDRVFSVVAEIR